MPRYFFHVNDGDDHPDSDGVDFPDFQAAHTDAIRAAAEMVRDLSGRLAMDGDWRMDVADATGRTVLTLRFTQTVPPV